MSFQKQVENRADNFSLGRKKIKWKCGILIIGGTMFFFFKYSQCGTIFLFLIFKNKNCPYLRLTTWFDIHLNSELISVIKLINISPHIVTIYFMCDESTWNLLSTNFQCWVQWYGIFKEIFLLSLRNRDWLVAISDIFLFTFI